MRTGQAKGHHREDGFPKEEAEQEKDDIADAILPDFLEGK